MPGQQLPEVVVGRLPENFPADLLLPGNTEVLGGLRYVGGTVMRGPQASVVAIIRSNDEAVITSMQAAWERAGWNTPREMDRQGGFLQEILPRSRFFCRDSSYVNVAVWPRRAGGRYLRIDLSTMQMTPCQRMVMRNPELESGREPFPALRAPQGAISIDASMSGSQFAREASARLETDMTPVQLIAHYGAQLKAAGWTLRETASVPKIAMQIAEKRNSRGNVETGILSAIAVESPRLRDVLFRIIWVDTDRRR